ncbi:hypothetical protein [Amycolatopsis regifaucium]|uniref:Uncharacterized protein n=1 Tax=Amycolatopsis regifaucium TaxID=546365 RepID=A0A154MED8_9PSEU|nr:hypothetical protein [Amycolatopsis regifaucium]KZB82580.1 hypothetical protein AVL48_08755 [Amycolatopsis regifaucium]OKA06491.1 hypothetical protein ATP06_0222235 [Amycolatopsis regifaucium]
MDHHVIPASSGSPGVGIALVLLRLGLLLATAFLAGTGILRPLVGELPRRLYLTIAALGGVSAALAAVSAFATDVNVIALIVHIALALALPVLVRWPSAGRWASLALAALVVLETSLGRSGVEFAIDTGYVAAAALWFGVTVLSVWVPAAGWRQTNFRLGPLSLTLGGLLVVAGAVQLFSSGLGLDRRIYGTFFGITLLVIAVLPAVATVIAGFFFSGKDSTRAYRLGAAAVAVGFVAWSALAAIPKPPELPIPGVPLLADASVGGQRIPVLVSPQRPGKNLVHFPASAGDGLSAGIEGGLIGKAIVRPGAEGTWAEVDLPKGRSDLIVSRGEEKTTIEVDAGEEQGPAIEDTDAPECASAALGGLIADRRDVLTACPAATLSGEDSGSLVKLVEFLAGRKPSALTLVEDTSPRSAAAAKLVRETAARAGLPVQAEAGPNTALVVVSGWAGGYTAMTRAAESQRLKPTHQYGLYLAPWLLNGPIVNAVASSSLPLRFDPREQVAVSYAVATNNAFGGESPTLGGFRNWLGGQWTSVNGDVQIFAAAQVNAMPMYPGEPHAAGMIADRNYAGQWIPDGTIVPVSSVLR